MSESLDFSLLQKAVQKQFATMSDKVLYKVKINTNTIWKLYLDSFPPGTNPIFRKRAEHDCSCCRGFIKTVSGIVTINQGKIVSLWDIEVEAFQPIINALRDYVKSLPIENLFLHYEPRVGQEKNFEQIWDSEVKTWNHFAITLPASTLCRKDAIGTKLGGYTTNHDVGLRGCKEITIESLQIVKDLINQSTLYRGSEHLEIVKTFSRLKKEFDTLPENLQDNYVWSQVKGSNTFALVIKNTVIGTLLMDISEGVELEKAVKAFELKVAPTNYKRPTSLITPAMRDKAKTTLEDLGLLPSLERRYATLQDIPVTEVLFVDRAVKSSLSGASVFDDLPLAPVSVAKLRSLEEVSINKFITDILPSATSIEVLLENRHIPNLLSLVAPVDYSAPTLFKWPNSISWSYNGDYADSLKEKVKAAGGNVTGEICCRLEWFNTDDLDLHMKQPAGYSEIYFGRKSTPTTGGQLDVDMNAGKLTTSPVENIYYGRISQMKPGTYQLRVHQYSKRNSSDFGFRVEIDILGTTHQFSYNKALTTSENIHVADLKVTTTGVELVPMLATQEASREIWSLKTAQYVPVTTVLHSPNYWEGAGVGNKHTIFTLKGCKNDGSARPFYNEFLKSELEPHRKTMEIVGSKMKTEKANDQLSGLGFSETSRNSLTVRVTGSYARTLKIII